jgi:hypothetical protein
MTHSIGNMILAACTGETVSDMRNCQHTQPAGKPTLANAHNQYRRHSHPIKPGILNQRHNAFSKNTKQNAMH